MMVQLDIQDGFETLKLANCFDHRWVFKDNKGQMKFEAKADRPITGLVMEIHTDQPGAQVIQK